MIQLNVLGRSSLSRRWRRIHRLRRTQEKASERVSARNEVRSFYNIDALLLKCFMLMTQQIYKCKRNNSRNNNCTYS
jgi:hypothetical protein